MMILKRIVLPFVLALIVQIVNAQTNNRTTYNFNSDWKVIIGDIKGAEQSKFDDKEWKTVTLPRAFNEDEAFRLPIHEHSGNIVWYRKYFKLPESGGNEKVFLEFEGIRQGGEFYLNGEFIGRHENGVMAFGFDISDKLLPNDAENVLAVRVDNAWDYREKSSNSRYQWVDKNFNANYGGIPKNVFLHVTGKLYQTLPLFSALKTTGVYIYASDFNIPKRSATVHAESEVRNETGANQSFTYEVEMIDAEGKTVKTFKGKPVILPPGKTTTVKASSKVNELNFWSWGYGYLYTVNTRLLVNNAPVDLVSTKTGFRKTEFSNGEVKLNDRVLQMKGYAQRTSNEWPAIGLSVPAWVSDFSNQLILESNGNFVRWMHVTPWKQDVESFDRLGLIHAMPAGDAEHDVTGRRWEQRLELMRDAIIYNRNNPSVIFYEAGNKGVSEEHMQEMVALRDQYDPHGGRASGSREMLDSKVAEYGGEMLYINKSANIPLWSMEYSRDEGLRKYWDEYTYPYHKDGDGPLYNGQDASDYNRNQDSHAIENVIRWFDYWRERPGTGKRVSSGGAKIIFSDSNTHFRGAENYRRSGVVDPMRLPKDGFFAHQVMWDGWVDIENSRTHIIGHWNYTDGVKKNISVVSSGEKVELLVNGQSKGFGEQDHRFLFTFKDIDFNPGEIKAISYNKEGKQLSQAILKTAGVPVGIRLTLHQHPDGMRADGADLALVDVEVVDAEGNRCPTALNMIDFVLEGAAEWRGGIAQGPNNYILSKSLPVEGGVNRIILRSLPQAGDIELKAMSNGLESNSIKFASKSFTQENGLSLIKPSDGLSSNLERGATPLTSSYTISRIPLEVKSVKAGSNQDLAALSFDDNERTDWNNDGILSTAWIEYEFKKASTISEVTMKLNNFRRRSYPLLITVDGKEVYRGNTERGLGYITIPFTPVKGKTVKVELIDSKDVNLIGDVFAMQEVGGQILEDGVSRSDAQTQGRLSILEIEFYERITDGAGLLISEK